MKHVLFEHPVTHQFAMIKLPPSYLEGDRVVPPPGVRWFDTREQALATLSNLLDDDDEDAPDEVRLH
jgi:hypothetical protein